MNYKRNLKLQDHKPSDTTERSLIREIDFPRSIVA